ncbi:MAG: transcription elongation factor GreA [Micavibrio aeruginosavorus]|uniref:Transcription elongation factor GreA n=1 Tax=Micavibrio aeruginosavorus TaxID=349221 RepID=A0A2W5MTL4_9BACT|nr:MAG: transcription elongation factor GreA [Micavibrio aeruginosavorus]
MDKIPMTREGVEALEKELRLRISETRPEIVAAIAEARAHGDLSENAEYSAARERQSFNEGRIKELEAVIGSADIIDPAQFVGHTSVKFGALVVIIDEDDNERRLMIVGEYESNADEGRISITSPIARGLIGKSMGDTVEIRTPKGATSYEIIEVIYA